MTIKKSIKIERPPEIAFKVFAEEIGAWWPLHDGFSFGGPKAKQIRIEGRVGGRFYERFTDGTEYEIGRVTVYDPPALIAFTWQAPTWEGSTRVAVRFVPDGAGTRVEVEHDGWEAGPVVQSDRKSYDRGWDFVLGRYSASAVKAA